MTDNTTGPAAQEPQEPNAGDVAETAEVAATAPAADVEAGAEAAVADASTEAQPAAEAPAPAPAVDAAPAVQAQPAAEPAPTAPAPAAPAVATLADSGWVAPAAAASAPAQPTGVVNEPGQAPQPYHAPQYSHTLAQAPASAQPAAAQPAAAQPASAQPAAAQPASAQPAAAQPASAQPAAAQPAAPQAPAAATQPTEPLGRPAPGQVPPAFGGSQQTQPLAGTPAPAAPKKRPVALGVAAAIVAAALIGGAAGAGITGLLTADRTTTTSADANPQNVIVNDTDSVNQTTAVAAKASPSVVTISVAAESAGGSGSGIILSEDGYVLTNTHVVTLDGATGDPTIQVETNDGRLYAAELIGTDPLSDLAVIKLVDASGLTPLEFADSSKLNVGDAAIAIGAPLGLSGTVTDGIVSALNRSIEVASSAAPAAPGDGQSGDGAPEGGDGSQQEPGQQPFDFWNFGGEEGQQGQPQQQQASGVISIPVIQTDAAINPGNSGGALLDSEGKLIGVNVAILGTGDSSGGQAGNIGVGFAVPSNLAERVANEIIENGAATHGLLGATVTAAESDEKSTTVGALITEVSAGGAAANAGLESGDVVTKFNGLPITDQTDLTAQVRALAGGAEAEVTVIRDGEAQTVTVTLGTFEG